MGVFASSIGHMSVLYEGLLHSYIICASTGGSIWGDEVEPSSPGKDWASSKAGLAEEVTIMPRSKEHLTEGSHMICLCDTIIEEQELPRLEPPRRRKRSHAWWGDGPSNYRMVQVWHSPVLTVPPAGLTFHGARGVNCEHWPLGASIWNMLDCRNTNPNKPQFFAHHQVIFKNPFSHSIF